MNLNTSNVYKCLEKKTLILGFEIIDLFALMMILSVLNFVTGSSEWKFFLTWIPIILIGAVLRIAKKGKPDQFLVHWLRFQVLPGVFWGWPEAESQNALFHFQTIKRRKQIA